MYVVRSKNTGQYLSGGSGYRQKSVDDIKKARVYNSELGAKKSITFGLVRENSHLLDLYDVISITIRKG